MTDALTIVRARGRRLAKLVQPVEIIGYDSAKTVNLHHQGVADLATLHLLLEQLLQRPDCCVVRGAIRDPGRTRGVRRLLHDDDETGDAATLAEVPRRWLALDMDAVERPEGVSSADLAGCATAALLLLPNVFSTASCIVQATAGHGLKPGARLRLWFWCDRPLSGAECKRWLKAAPVDLSVFGAAQPIYTAAPVFAGGATEHLPQRLLLLPGNPVLHTPSAAALAPPPPPRRSGKEAQAAGTATYALAALSRAAARISSAGNGSRHETAKREAWGLARLVRVGLLTEAEVKRTIGTAIATAGKDAEEGEALAAWAIAHRSDGGRA